MKDLGVLKYFLSIEIAHNSTGIYLCQWKYTLEIISEVGLSEAKPFSIPIEPNHRLATSTLVFFHMLDRYYYLIGKLIYLTLARPKLAFVVHTLTQFMQIPRVDHWEVALCVVRYLKGNPDQGTFFVLILH